MQENFRLDIYKRPSKLKVLKSGNHKKLAGGLLLTLFIKNIPLHGTQKGGEKQSRSRAFSSVVKMI